MTDFINGYSPGTLAGSVSVYLDGPPHIEENYYITVGFGGQTNQDTENALVAGLEAIRDYVQTSFPAAAVTVNHRVTGVKEL